jgi:hypothetical protein
LESRLWGMWRRTPGSEKGRMKFLYTFFPRVFGLPLAIWGTDMVEIASRLLDYTGLPQATKAISYVLGQYARARVGVFLCITWVRREGCWFRALVES